MVETGEAIRLTVSKISDLNGVASSIIGWGKGFNIWLFDGEMGSGKTTLIREICNIIGVNDNVTSPSFGLVNEYQSFSGPSIYHFDFFRIKNEEEAERIGLNEYFYSENLCMIEWPEKINSLLPHRYLRISMKIIQDQQREIYLNKHE